MASNTNVAHGSTWLPMASQQRIVTIPTDFSVVPSKVSQGWRYRGHSQGFRAIRQYRLEFTRLGGCLRILLLLAGNDFNKHMTTGRINQVAAIPNRRPFS
jgi:hypothetical protein